MQLALFRLIRPFVVASTVLFPLRVAGTAIPPPSTPQDSAQEERLQLTVDPEGDLPAMRLGVMSGRPIEIQLRDLGVFRFVAKANGDKARVTIDRKADDRYQPLADIVVSLGGEAAETQSRPNLTISVARYPTRE